MIKILPIQTKKQRAAFLKFPYKIYQNYPHWIPPLLVEQRKLLHPRRSPFLQHSEAQLFLAVKNDEICGRISAHTNTQHNKTHNDRTGFFGFFECIDDQEAADHLLKAAENWLKEKDRDSMRGPANFSVNETCGLLLDSFDDDPMIMMTYNPPYYQKLFSNYGLEKLIDLYAYKVEISEPSERLKKMSDHLERKGNFVVRSLDKSSKRKLRSDLRKIFHVYEKAWQDNWGYVPMTDEEFEQTVENLLPVIKPEFVYLAEVDGKAVGVCAILPDYNFVIKKMNGKIFPFGWLKFLYYQNKISRLRLIIMGILDDYKRRGIDVIFYRKAFEAAFAQRKQYRSAELSWILENNTMMNRILQNLGAEIYKTYRFYEKKLINKRVK